MNLPPNPAAWPARWREAYEERAGILEYLGNVSRDTAEVRAAIEVRREAAMEPRKERSA